MGAQQKAAQQAVFDRVLAHLRQQGRPAISKWGSCSYRSDDGLRCAIGALIPDDRYDTNMEGATAKEDRVFYALPAEVREAGPDFLLYIQQELHDAPSDYDGENFLNAMEVSAKRIAKNYDLIYIAPRAI